MLPIGILFHISAAVAVVFPFAKFKLSWKMLGIAFALSFAIWFLSDILLGRVMMALLGGMGSLVEKIIFYSIQASTIFGFLRSAITYLIFPFVIMYSVMQNEKDEDRSKKFSRMISYMLLLGVLASSFAGFSRLYNYVRVFYLILFADFIYTMFREKKHLIIRLGTFCGTVFLVFLQYMIPYKTTNTYYYDYFYPYTSILEKSKDVYIREVAHSEAVMAEESDNNVREIKWCTHTKRGELLRLTSFRFFSFYLKVICLDLHTSVCLDYLRQQGNHTKSEEFTVIFYNLQLFTF